MPVEINKIIRSKRQSIGLEITAEAQLVVRVPYLTSMKTVQKIIEQKKKWIQEKLSIAQNKHSKRVERSFQEGEMFLYLGEKYPLVFVEKEEEALVFEKEFKLTRAHQRIAKEHFLKWYKKKALKKFTERIHLYYAITGFAYKKIRLSGAEKRWGSCNARGTLSLSWRLIMAPLDVIDYVVVHEMVHLKVRDHSRNFWNAVEKVLPDYRESKRWLKENGYKLSL